MPQTHDPKPDDPEGTQRADVELARAYERIKSADEELARLDRVVSGMERDSDSPSIPEDGARAERSDATVESNARHPGLRGKWLTRGGLAGLLFAVGFLGGTFTSHYGNEARAIVARWAAATSTAPPEANELRSRAKSLTIQIADSGEHPSAPAPSTPPAPSSHKQADDVPSGSTASTDSTSADLAQSLRIIAHDLASINEKLGQLKSSHEQTLRDHADAIQQLKTAQEQGARDNARIAQQVQTLQTRLAALSAKSTGRSLMKENDAATRQHLSAGRPRRPRIPWTPPPDMIEEPWADPYW